MDDYLSFLDALQVRFHGPVSFRLILQPLIALFLAFRDGRKDAMEGRPSYFWALYTDSEHRREMLQSGWKSIGKVFILAMILDIVFQLLVFRGIHPGAAFVVAVILAVVPYLLMRGPIYRLIRMKSRGAKR